MNLQQLRQLDDDAEAAIRRISLVKLAATVVMVLAAAFVAQLILLLVTT